MKEIVKKIFYDYNFEERKIPSLFNKDLFFAVNFNKECLNFYIVVFINEINDNFLDDQVLEYYNAIKGLELGYDERMDKNLSMLVCLRSDDELKKKELLKKIFEIEEDPYFFKKYVFSYTDEHYKILSDYFESNNNIHSKTLLNNIVNDNELFISFKSQPNDASNSLYNLCSKLLIKLPFVVFERGEKKIENLTEKIRENLQIEDLVKYSDEWLKIEEKKNGYNIDDILAVILEGDEHNEL